MTPTTLTEQEMAEALKLKNATPIRTVQRMARAGYFGRFAFKVGREWRFLPNALEALGMAQGKRI